MDTHSKEKKSLKRKGKGSSEDELPADQPVISVGNKKQKKVANRSLSDSEQELIVPQTTDKVSNIPPKSSVDEIYDSEATLAKENNSDNEDIPSNSYNKSSTEQEVIVILDGAQLETVKTKKGDFQLLNCDDHINLMRKHHKDPQLYRPDIIHQVHNNLTFYI